MNKSNTVINASLRDYYSKYIDEHENFHQWRTELTDDLHTYFDTLDELPKAKTIFVLKDETKWEVQSQSIVVYKGVLHITIMLHGLQLH